MGFETAKLKKVAIVPPPTDGAPGIPVASPSPAAAPVAASDVAAAPAAKKPDGRSRRATGRTITMGIKVSPRTQSLIHQLSEETSQPMSAVIEQAINAFAERVAKGRR